MQLALSTPDAPRLTEVGGKAASLIRLAQGGFRVPDGVVLTTEFFSLWIEQIELSQGADSTRLFRDFTSAFALPVPTVHWVYWVRRSKQNPCHVHGTYTRQQMARFVSKSLQLIRR